MAPAADILRMSHTNMALRDAFRRWQCRIRQMIMREEMGRPNDGIMPQVYLGDAMEPVGQIITVMSKLPEYSLTPELQHLYRKTADPASRRENALKLFSETYYQKAREFSDQVTATFQPDSEGARAIEQAGRCRLVFEAYKQRYTLHCTVWNLTRTNPQYEATFWHNMLFNPTLPKDTIILGFEPDWSSSHAEPSPVESLGATG